MSKIVTYRVTEEEAQKLERASQLERQPGDRGGVNAYARRAALRDAERVIDAESLCDNPECPVGCPDTHAELRASEQE